MVNNESTKDGLTGKVALFVAEYQKDHNATQAAIRAGYSASTAKQQGSRLLTRVDVRQACDAAQQIQIAQIAHGTGITLERTLTKIAEIGFSSAEEVKTADQIRALDMLMKHLGGYAKDNEATVHVKDDAMPLNELGRRFAFVMLEAARAQRAANDTQSPQPRQAAS